MTTAWDDYEPYVPLDSVPHHETTRAQAKKSFEHLMAARPERERQLRNLLAANDIDLGADDTALQQLNDWFATNVEPNPDDPGRLRNLWYAVVNDVSLYLGDVLIAREPALSWAISPGGKRDLAYNKHVVVGFTKVANPKFYVDIDRLVATHAHQIIAGKQVDKEFFVRLLQSAQAKA